MVRQSTRPGCGTGLFATHEGEQDAHEEDVQRRPAPRDQDGGEDPRHRPPRGGQRRIQGHQGDDDCAQAADSQRGPLGAADTMAGYISTEQSLWGLHRILDGLTDLADTATQARDASGRGAERGSR